MSAPAVSRPAPVHPTTFREAVSRLGGACCIMLMALNETDETRRARARDKLFDAAMWAALLILEEDAANPQEETWTR